MYLAIKSVQPLENYHLLLTFENNEKRIFNVSPYLTDGIFKQLVNEELFNTVKVCFDTICWDNEADLCPEFLYEKSEPYNYS